MSQSTSFRARRAGSPSRRSFGGKHQRPVKKGNRKQYIHPSKFVNRTPIEQLPDAYVPTHRFNDFKLNDKVKQNLAHIGFDAPSAI